MELFSEIYNCYFRIVEEICKAAQDTPITEKEMLALAAHFGYEESGFILVPQLINNWKLLKKVDGGYLSQIDTPEILPLTLLQKSWLKAILLDRRIGLFLEDSQRDILNRYLSEVSPLFLPEDFYYYDRFQDGDDFTSPEYVSHFRLLLKAIRLKQYVNIHFSSRRKNELSHIYLPYRLEYSSKNDKFRLLALSEKNQGKYRVEIINLSRIDRIALTDRTHSAWLTMPDLKDIGYYREPVKLLITTKRNTLERTMLHFANYEKQTKKLDNEHYECLIYYNSMMEIELLIEILSFGPTVKVLGPKDFLAKVRARVKRQGELLISP